MSVPHTYLITGGTGSFGHAMCRALLNTPDPHTIRIYSRDEVKQADMGKWLVAEGLTTGTYPNFERVRFLGGDVRDLPRLRMAMHEVDSVIHAAALKRVEFCQYNTDEAYATNCGGAVNVRQAAIDCGVERVLALSTDKACAPVNVYGKTKALAEDIILAGHIYRGREGPRFGVLRYGNVAGSRGSVIPIWREQLKQGKTSLTLTDEGMTRFWFLLDDAVAFALRVLNQMRGGELYVPKLPSFKLTDLVQAVGTVPIGHIGCIKRHYTIVGQGEGEKLHEAMVSRDEAFMFRDWDGCYVRFQPGTEQGERLPVGFQYDSETNTEWLGVEELRELLTEIP